MKTPAEIIEQTRVPHTNSVFFLGCFENRVTLYSQQVRALNLVDAILDRELVRKDGKVAIVGGGAAGITAAAALAKAAPSLKRIDLFETRGEILELQQQSDRFLHPHLYDWPATGAENTEAGLPILNWRAGPAGEVAESLRRQFDDIERASRINVLCGANVTAVKPHPLTQASVEVNGLKHFDGTYDVVILSIGFGLEAHLDGDTSSYWTPSSLAAPILIGGAPPTIFVSGNGDGGLVDFMIAALNGLTHSKICQIITGLRLGNALAELLKIEEEAWQPGAEVDLFAEYRARVLPLLPGAVLAEIGDRLRAGVSVWLHTAERHLFKRTSAFLNRLGVFLVIEADRNLSRGAITVKVGTPFAGGVPTSGPVQFDGEANLLPWRRILRLGANSAANRAPFESLMDRMPDSMKQPDRTFRPATPTLTQSAVERFGKFNSPAKVPGFQASPLNLPSISTTHNEDASLDLSQLFSALNVEDMRIEKSFIAAPVDFTSFDSDIVDYRGSLPDHVKGLKESAISSVISQCKSNGVTFDNNGSFSLRRIDVSRPEAPSGKRENKYKLLLEPSLYYDFAFPNLRLDDEFYNKETRENQTLRKMLGLEKNKLTIGSLDEFGHCQFMIGTGTLIVSSDSRVICSARSKKQFVAGKQQKDEMVVHLSAAEGMYRSENNPGSSDCFEDNKVTPFATSLRSLEDELNVGKDMYRREDLLCLGYFIDLQRAQPFFLFYLKLQHSCEEVFSRYSNIATDVHENDAIFGLPLTFESIHRLFNNASFEELNATYPSICEDFFSLNQKARVTLASNHAKAGFAALAFKDTAPITRAMVRNR